VWFIHDQYKYSIDKIVLTANDFIYLKNINILKFMPSKHFTDIIGRMGKME